VAIHQARARGGVGKGFYLGGQIREKDLEGLKFKVF